MSKDREYMRQYMLERYKRRYAAAVQQLGGKCAKCGGTEDLEFDHIDPSTKKSTMARILAGGSEKRVQEELLKCQLLCKDHHTEKTIQEAGKQPARCGTLSGYRYCKCEKCKEAKMIHDKEYKKKRRGAQRIAGVVA